MSGDDFDHLHQRLRAQTVRALVHEINDSGGDQVLKAESHFGNLRSEVPVHQAFGFASSAPLDGAVTMLVQPGGDPSDLVALPPYNPYVRFGGLNQGESVVYDAVGQRLHFRDGVLCDVQAKNEFRVSIGGTQVFDLTAQKCVIGVPLVAQKGIVSQGDVVAGAGADGSGGVSALEHAHTEVQTGLGVSGPPQQT